MTCGSITPLSKQAIRDDHEKDAAYVHTYNACKGWSHINLRVVSEPFLNFFPGGHFLNTSPVVWQRCYITIGKALVMRRIANIYQFEELVHMCSSVQHQVELLIVLFVIVQLSITISVNRLQRMAMLVGEEKGKRNYGQKPIKCISPFIHNNSSLHFEFQITIGSSH
jgi:hypothetical protein